MRCPSLNELPRASGAQSGWPWTDEPTRLSETMPDGGAWPKISIVTPSFNQGEYIEETIRSILLQGYPNIEYIIIDGGSTDQTVDIIRSYEPWLKYWVSESDNGQAHAINKGLAYCSGEIFQWINSDDVVLPGALRRVAEAMSDHDLVAGGGINFDASGFSTFIPNASLTMQSMVEWPEKLSFHQPGLWLKTPYVQALGKLDESWSYVFDVDLMIKYLGCWSRIKYIQDPLVKFRLHPGSKTVSQQSKFESENIALREKLLRTETGVVRKYCQKYLNVRKWRKKVDAIRFEDRRSSVRRSLEIALLSILNPRLRFNRFTFGAIRRIVRREPTL